MTIFEHIMITSSIILGLAIAQLLTGFADSLRLKSVQRYWPQSVWAVAQLLACINWGFGVWIYEQRTSWTGIQLLLFILTPVLTFLMARFTYPNLIAEHISLKAHYYDTRRYTYGLAALIMTELNLSLTLMAGRPLISPENAVGVVTITALASLAVSSNERLHKLLAPFVLAIILVFSIYFQIANP